jgi:hypothetical protein
MTRSPAARRRAPIVFSVASALLGAALVGGGVAAQASAPAVASHQHAAMAQTVTPRTADQVAFHDQMRKLWEDHATWTRLAIVTFADGSSGFAATADRLLQNQADIGDAIRPFYGDAAGDRLTSLLRDHITIAVELLKAAKAGDTAAFADARTRWYANGNDIADFLAAANPANWPQDAMRAAMTHHLDQTLAEAAHELGGDYTASVGDYEAIHEHILAMADTLSSGLIAAFPSRFH